MERAFASVAIENTVYHFDQLFTYLVPQEFVHKLLPGMRVTVSFGPGNKERVAVVFSLEGEDTPGLKPILSILDHKPVLSQKMLDLALWMQGRYYCTLFEAVKQMIPAGNHLRLKSNYVLAPDFKNFDREEYTSLQWQLILSFRSAGRSIPFEKISKTFGIEENYPDFQSLVKRGILCKVNVASGKIKDATSKTLRPVAGFTGKLTPRQKSVFETLLDAGEASEKELCYFTGASSAVIKALVEKGAAETFEYEIYRRPDTGNLKSETREILLSEEQEKVLKNLVSEYESQKGTALLYGVTGSGKTSVFLKLIAHVLRQGKDVIALVPEISLTAQTIRQFRGLFGDAIALFHSGLSLGERLDEWKRVQRGEARIVVGTRSAVFAPVKDLGLIVIDEEQEHTYHSESSPRYDAREVAQYRCRQSNAFCLLCSATPSIETFRMVQEKKYKFHQLTSRFGQATLPEVELIDRNLDQTDLDCEIGEALGQALRENFQQKKQSIILLNRRGYHTFAACRNCHETLTCPHCSISLTYHSANQRLMCHYCGYSIPFTKKCPSCGKDTIVFRGAGTQKAEEQLKELLPAANILRVDTDSITTRHFLEKKLEDFAGGYYDVMVGTQMVAKGLDFPNVTLVGVLSADATLFNDDFRSNERTFDLLTQVVGRSGRGRYSGKAMIQTFFPENPILHLAANQDYFSFYRREISYRKALLYPPFADLLVLGFVGAKEPLVKSAAEHFLSSLGTLAEQEYSQLPMRVLRPSPASVAKVSGKYRYKIIVKCKNTPAFREMIARLLKSFARISQYKEVTVYADSNPYTIL